MPPPWIPPSATALKRWHRLYREAVDLVGRPMASGAPLMQAAMAVEKDPYPTGDRAHWQGFGAWVKAARAFATATPLERRTDADSLAEGNHWVGRIMGLVEDQDLPVDEPPQPAAPRYRADLDG